MKGRPQAKNSTCVAFSIFWDLYVLKYMELLQKNKKEKREDLLCLQISWILSNLKAMSTSKRKNSLIDINN